jgi:hypothetical protein
MKKYSKLVQSIIENLCDRGGFDEWWYNIDDDIKREIRVEMRQTIEKWIDSQNNN